MASSFLEEVCDIASLKRVSDHVFPAESTTIALLARLAGLIDPLRKFLKTKPVWGTCAGAILLAQGVKGAKKGGQELLGGVSITIARNGWGSQVRLNPRTWSILKVTLSDGV